MIYLGCDGGSTKTEWLLADETGKVLSHRVFEGCNFAFLGEKGFRDLMRRCIESLLKDAGALAQEVSSAMLGMTVYGEVPGTEQIIPDAIRAVLPQCRITVENDSVAGWSGSLCARPGINLVAGTGSVAYGQDSAGNGCRVGGWSLFFADEGSCSWVARQMITEFVKQADGRHPRGAIYKEMQRELHLEKDVYFSGFLQVDVRNHSEKLAKLQLVALRAAQSGDPTAQTIYRQAAKELTEMAVTIRRQLGFPAGQAVAVSYSGGLFHAGDVIFLPLKEEMEKNGFSLVAPRFSPIIGALLLAAAEDMDLSSLERMAERVERAITNESKANNQEGKS